MLLKIVGIISLTVIGTLVISYVLIATLQNAGYVSYQYSSSGDIDKTTDRTVDLPDPVRNTNEDNTFEGLSRYVSSKGDVVLVLDPDSGDTIGCGVTVMGTVPSSWVFEDNFPISVEDPEGNDVMAGYAKSYGDSMSQDKVDFSGSIKCIGVNCYSGDVFLVIHKENPSGLTENDDSVRIPLIMDGGDKCGPVR